MTLGLAAPTASWAKKKKKSGSSGPRQNGLPRGALGIRFNVTKDDSIRNVDLIQLKAELAPNGPYPTITLLIYRKFRHKNGGVYWHRVDNKRVCQHRKETVKATYPLTNWYTKNGESQPGEYFLSIHGQHYTYDLVLEKTSRVRQADGEWVNKVELIGAKRGQLGNGL